MAARVILVLGTYWAQPAADHGLGPHTAAYTAESKITRARHFRSSQVITCGFGEWGGWGSNPRPTDYESAALTG